MGGGGEVVTTQANSLQFSASKRLEDISHFKSNTRILYIRNQEQTLIVFYYIVAHALIFKVPSFVEKFSTKRSSQSVLFHYTGEGTVGMYM